MYRPCWLMGRLPSASWIFRWIKQTSAVKWAVELSILTRIQPSWKTLGLSTWAVSLAYYNSLKRYLSLAEWDCQEAVCSNPFQQSELLRVLLAPSGATNMTGHEGIGLFPNSYMYSYFLISCFKRMSDHFLVVVTTCDDPFTSRQQRIVVGCNPYCSRRHFFTRSFKRLFYLFLWGMIFAYIVKRRRGFLYFYRLILYTQPRQHV